MAAEEATDCRCTECQAACRHKPGWFLPGQVERVAEHLGCSVEHLFAHHLMVDYLGENEFDEAETVFLLAPAIVGGTPGEEYPADPRGVCVFFQDGRCAIHAAKPYECRATLHGDGDAVVAARHYQVAQAWRNEAAQAQIRALLGREPESAGEFSLLGSILGGDW